MNDTKNNRLDILNEKERKIIEDFESDKDLEEEKEDFDFRLSDMLQDFVSFIARAFRRRP